MMKFGIRNAEFGIAGEFRQKMKGATAESTRF